MPVNKSALIRYRVINKYLIDHNGATKDELRRACERALDHDVGVRTIDADINAMRKDDRLGYNAPIAFDRWKGIYYYNVPGYTIEEIPMSKEEYEALLLAAKLLQQFSDAPVFQNFSETVKRVARQSGLPDYYRTGSSLYRFLEFEGHKENSSTRFLPEAINAVSHQIVTEIEYEDYYSEKTEDYIAHPALVKQYRSNWYLIAWQEAECRMKTFSLNRMKSLKLREDLIFISKRFCSAFFYKDLSGIPTEEEQYFEEEYTEVIEVYLAFSNVHVNWVLSHPIHDSQEIVSVSDSEIVAKYKLHPSHEFVSLVIGWGENVKVLKPEYLAETVNRKLRFALDKYS
jgi:predicted DNA-binding transcriptional regulator YafY